MVHYVETIAIDGERFIDYCSEENFNYSIKIGQLCKVVLVNEDCYTGILYQVNENSFILQFRNGENMEINYSDIDDILAKKMEM